VTSFSLASPADLLYLVDLLISPPGGERITQ
jgi:hypothetical protein